MNNLVIVAGPTAVGKSAAAIKLAKRINGNVISADSMQVYKGMDIGTAKVMPDETEGVKHYLIDVLSPVEAFDVHTFNKMAKEAICQCYDDSCVPIIAGGTGFYIQSVLYDISFEKEDDNSTIRKEYEQIAKTEGGIDLLHQKLSVIDKESAEKIHKNNVKRVIRALEFYDLNGYKISEHNEREMQKKSPYNNAYFVLNDDREYIYNRCDKRVDLMIQKGLVDEVKSLADKGYSKDLVSMQGLGYKEILDYLNGKISLDEAIYIIKRDTRHFVKRQLTYFRREKDTIWIDCRDYDRDSDKIAKRMEQICNERGII